jgi:hypothetical protein
MLASKPGRGDIRQILGRTFGLQTRLARPCSKYETAVPIPRQIAFADIHNEPRRLPGRDP